MSASQIFKRSVLTGFAGLLVGLIVGALALQNGLNAHMDTFWYAIYGRGIALGQGLTIPISSWNTSSLTMSLSQWPPLYPLFLSLGGANNLWWAQISGVLLLGVCCALTAYIALRITGSTWLALLSVVLYVVIPSVYSVFSAGASEPLFTLLMLALVAVVLRGTPSPLIMGLAAGLTGLLLLTRYSGGGIVAGVLVYCVWQAVRKPEARRQWGFLAAAMIVGCLPLLGWMLYLHQLTGSWTGLQVTSDALSLKDIPGTFHVILTELFNGLRTPFRFIGIETNWAGVGVALGLGAWVFARLRKQKISLNHLLAPGQGLILCVIALYILVFWVLSIRSDHIFAGDNRHYVPIYPLILIVLVDIIRRVSWPSWGVALLLICYILGGITALREVRGGILYNAPSYQNLTPMLSSRLQSLPPGTLLHTQDVGYIAYYAPERPIRIFHILDAWTQGLTCADVIYLDGYKQAAFLTIDSSLVYDLSLEEINTRWIEWATPCGTPAPVEQIGIARLLQFTLP